jgi:ferredoxin
MDFSVKSISPNLDMHSVMVFVSGGWRIQSVYFSATGTTRKTLSTIEEHTGLPTVSQIDLTLPKQREAFTGKVQGDLILVGAPVYGGSPPWPMMEPLNRLEGGGKWAVPVAVYGNRSPDTCVEELANILRSRGFKILAAASFIAQHSGASKDHPWAWGRPDRSDLEKAAWFGEQVKEKVFSNPSEIQTSDRLLNSLTGKMVESLPQGYHKRLAERIKGLFTVAFLKDKVCTECTSCANACPTDAIDIASKEISNDLCIRCMACIRACPEGVLSSRLNDPQYAQAFYEKFDKIFAVRKEPKTYL